MTFIYIAGEDPVTLAVVRRLVMDYAPNLSILREEPFRGSKLKGMIPQFNQLANSIPVILLGDLDTQDCAPMAKTQLLGGQVQNPNFIINIAVDEAEAWLYADPIGLSGYLKVPRSDIPASTNQLMGGPRSRIEVDVPMKTSLHLTSRLILKSSDENLKKQLKSSDGRCKGKEYNLAMIPFILNHWNPERARVNSYSLNGAITRIIDLNNRC